MLIIQVNSFISSWYWCTCTKLKYHCAEPSQNILAATFPPNYYGSWQPHLTTSLIPRLLVGHNYTMAGSLLSLYDIKLLPAIALTKVNFLHFLWGSSHYAIPMQQSLYTVYSVTLNSSLIAIPRNILELDSFIAAANETILDTQTGGYWVELCTTIIPQTQQAMYLLSIKH